MDYARFAFEHAPIGLVLTRHRTIERCNALFGEIFQYRPEELAGKSTSLLYPSHREFADIGRWALSAMLDDYGYEDQRIMKRRDGTQFWCSVRGRSTTPQDPYACCVWSYVDMTDHGRQARLTSREREVAMYVVRGLPNKEIGKKLAISHRTVEAHRSRMMRKLGVSNTAELIAALIGLPEAK